MHFVNVPAKFFRDDVTPRGGLDASGNRAVEKNIRAHFSISFTHGSRPRWRRSQRNPIQVGRFSMRWTDWRRSQAIATTADSRSITCRSSAHCVEWPSTTHCLA